MNKIENINNYFSFVPLYNFFIERYMIKANASFVIIYIYLLKCSINGEEIYLDKIASSLDMLASDIIKALDYWQSEKLIKYEHKENKIDIMFFNFQNVEPEKKTYEKTKKLAYTDDEITFFSQKDEIQQIFRLAEKKLAKTLTYQDRNILINIYENCGMSIEVLAMLLTYCKENGKNNLSYIEKVAIDWCENNIDTAEKVEAYLNIYNRDFKAIMKFFGIVNRTPVKKEEEIMKNWLLNYKMPLNIIEQACSRTVLKTGKASFDYANTILTDWKKNNVKTLEDIEKLDNQYESSVKAKREEKEKKLEQLYKANQPQKANNYPNKNRFINYDQKEPDYDLLRKIELMALKEGIEEND